MRAYSGVIKRMHSAGWSVPMLFLYKKSYYDKEMPQSLFLKFKMLINVALSINVHRGSYMSAHLLLNLLNELRKRDKM